MRILHTEWSEGYGGQERRILLECKGFKARGHYVAIACRPQARLYKWAKKEGIEVFEVPFHKALDFKSIFKLIKIIREKNIEIVNTHSGIDSWCGGLAAKLASVSVLVRTRHLSLPLKRNIFNFIHYMPDMIITCGENMRKNLIKNCGFPPDKLISIPTGVENKFFSIIRDKSLKNKYGLKEDTPVIVNIGILRREKGHEITLRAFKLVLEKIPEAMLLIVGDGPSKPRILKEVENLNLNNKVIFTGFIDDPSEVLAFADIFVMSPWPISEGLPQSLLQAFAAGVPAVATCVGSIPEVLIDNKTGLLIKPGDYRAMADSIIKMLYNYKWALELALQGKKIVEEKYSEKVMISKLENLYKELLKRKV
ncbi:glycosyltransferase [Thermodesulfovibrio aggregans]|uniref:Glycosyltransferase n=1 Tax=Thermodesulfovibrio aggregans TaxID=86166 RepID=A0A0U9HNE6_9BACT|nr:glycosyltransferase family 4 protein [Thermodesulfovibrio aggregans]GAQ94583.1 glycosyltransferase [Thermodesulfovibrio aggregans]